MMKKALICFMMVTVGVLFGLRFSVDDVMATSADASSIITGITSISAMGGCGVSTANTQRFTVVPKYGSACNSPYQCWVDTGTGNNNAPWCTGGTGACATASNVTGYTVTYLSKSGDTETYKLQISTSDTYQNIEGRIKRKIPKATLTAKAKDRYYKNVHDQDVLLNNSNAIDSKEVTVGGSATVTAKDVSGYVFSHWGSSCPEKGRDNAKKTCTVNPLNSDKTVYAYYGRRRTLTAYAWDVTNGKVLNDGKAIDGPKEGWYGEGSLSVSSANYNPTGYIWKSWDPTCSNSTKRTCTLNGVTNNTTVYGYYEQNTFEGRSVLSGDASADTGYSKTNITRVGTISNCSPTAGCSVAFDHYLKRASGTGGTGYNIYRSSNLIVSTRAIAGGQVIGDTYWDGKTSPSDSLRHSEFTTKLYPGMVLCERLNFESYSGNVQYTEVCASALGDVPNIPIPNPDPNPREPYILSGDESIIDIKVKNNSLSSTNRYSTYSREVYAKPNDTLLYEAKYDSIVQYTYYIQPQLFRINNGTAIDGGGSTIGSLFNAHKGSGLSNWNNGFDINYGSHTPNNDSNYPELIGSHTYGLGTEGVHEPAPNSKTVSPNNVGRSMDEQAMTSNSSSTATTPSKVSFTDSSGSNLATVLTKPIAQRAKARIPYNYENSIEISTPDDTVYYVGEKGSVETVITVGKRQNDVTEGYYATKVPGAKWKLQVCYGEGDDDCTETDEIDLGGTAGTLNAEGDMEGAEEKKAIEFTAQDYSAGTKICFMAAVFPQNSGEPTNWDNMEGNGEWQWSEQVCYLMAKRPSIQVWGGNIYSGGLVNTSLSKKMYLAGYNDNDYNPSPTNNNPYTFGSWGELGVIATGSITGFASASTLGYASNPTGQLSGILPPITGVNPPSNQGIPSPGGYQGSESGMFCRLSILSIANHNCSSGSAGQVGATSAVNGIKNDQGKIKDLASALGLGDPEIVSGSMSIDGESKTYYKSDGSITINGGTVPMGKTILIYAKNNITIDGDIHYQDISYDNIVETPKLIVYAGGNVNIACKVNRIDAVLMGNIVNTCSDGNEDNISAQEYSNQLTIYGAVIANKLEAKRTYGAAAGVNSMVSAEIIDFDPTLYLWKGINDIDNNDIEDNKENRSSSVDIVYTKELAPRY